MFFHWVEDRLVFTKFRNCSAETSLPRKGENFTKNRMNQNRNHLNYEAMESWTLSIKEWMNKENNAWFNLKYIWYWFEESQAVLHKLYLNNLPIEVMVANWIFTGLVSKCSNGFDLFIHNNYFFDMLISKSFTIFISRDWWAESLTEEPILRS